MAGTMNRNVTCPFCKAVWHRSLMVSRSGVVNCIECEEAAENVIQAFYREEKEMPGDWLPQVTLSY